MKRAATLATIATLWACSRSPVGPAIGSEFDLSLHQWVTISGTSLTVRFDSVVEDSRCPIGAYCEWEGMARVLVSITSGAQVEQFCLTTMPITATYRSQGWFIDFIGLEPYPSLLTQSKGPPILTLKVRQALD